METITIFAIQIFIGAKCTLENRIKVAICFREKQRNNKF